MKNLGIRDKTSRIRNTGGDASFLIGSGLNFIAAKLPIGFLPFDKQQNFYFHEHKYKKGRGYIFFLFLRFQLPYA
jgi:hypothetical protein